MKDNFSNQASEYAKFRPDYPDTLISYLLSCVVERKRLLDVATGNGQLAVKLAPFFEAVTATDISGAQLQNATPAPNIRYRKLPAEKTDFPEHHFDLVTVAQAVHWFDFEKFYSEVYRILKPDGVFAVLGYGLLTTNPHTDEIIRHFYQDIVGPFWDAERKYLDNHYQTIPFPFDEVATPDFTNQFTWDFGQLLGYLETWSAVAHYKTETGNNPTDLIRTALKSSWEAHDKQVNFPLLLRIGKPERQD